MILLLAACGTDYSILQDVEEVIHGGYVADEFEAVLLNVDFVAVVDESGSMDEERLELYQPVLDVLTELDATDDLEWRFTYRAADPGGASMGWVDTIPEVEAMLDQATRGTNEEEQGLGAVMRSMAFDSHRPDADSVFWIISDEPDQSLYVTPESYRSQLQNWKPSPYKAITVASVMHKTWIAADCRGELGEGYLEVADIASDLCDPSGWLQALTQATDHLDEINRSWTLSRDPMTETCDTCKVWWDGVRFHDWSFDWSSRTVVFNQSPDPETKIVITYATEITP